MCVLQVPAASNVPQKMFIYSVYLYQITGQVQTVAISEVTISVTVRGDCGDCDCRPD